MVKRDNNLSPEGAHFIKNFEGLGPHFHRKGLIRAYVCPSGKPTIGYGHTGPDVSFWDVRSGRTIPQEIANLLFEKDVEFAVKAVNAQVNVPLTQAQFDVLVSFVFNCGARALATSTLLKLLNKKDYSGVLGQLPRWNKDDKGKPIAGLTRRRAAECRIWETGHYD